LAPHGQSAKQLAKGWTDNSDIMHTSLQSVMAGVQKVPTERGVAGASNHNPVVSAPKAAVKSWLQGLVAEGKFDEVSEAVSRDLTAYEAAQDLLETPKA
jgi:hypothetical protein